MKKVIFWCMVTFILTVAAIVVLAETVGSTSSSTTSTAQSSSDQQVQLSDWQVLKNEHDLAGDYAWVQYTLPIDPTGEVVYVVDTPSGDPEDVPTGYILYVHCGSDAGIMIAYMNFTNGKTWGKQLFLRKDFVQSSMFGMIFTHVCGDQK